MSTTQKDPSARVRLAIIGASGRMGRKLIELFNSHAPATKNYQLVWQDSVRKPEDLKRLVSEQIDLVIDFAKPAATLAWVHAFGEVARTRRMAALICGTGFDSAEVELLKHSLRDWTWAFVPNTSLGIFAMVESLKILAKTLSPEYRFMIQESHHSQKMDSPSGTALLLKKTLEALRPQNESVEISSFRAGTDPGTHTVLILGPFEQLQLTHRAEDRTLFANGALTLGKLLVTQRDAGQTTLENLITN